MRCLLLCLLVGCASDPGADRCTDTHIELFVDDAFTGERPTAATAELDDGTTVMLTCDDDACVAEVEGFFDVTSLTYETAAGTVTVDGADLAYFETELGCSNVFYSHVIGAPTEG
jgi:hypothetical protein